MTDEQQAYSSEYHRALVEPFTDNRRWQQLLRTASSTWGQVFGHFPDLEEISVGCCERVDQPRPTSTYAFFLQYGKDVVRDVYPEFVEDSTTNLAWASSVVSKSAPPNVRSLRLSMSNMDNFNSVSTVNRLVSLTHRQFNPAKASIHITKLDLSLCGVAGTHGDRDYQGDTGSAGSVRLWRSVLTDLRSLQYLTLRNNLATDEPIRFSRMEKSDPYASVLGWLLPELALDQLQTLRICDFILDQAEVQTIFRAHWPRLERIVLDDVNLMIHWSGDIIDLDLQLKHLQGNSWLDFCRSLREEQSNVRLELNKPVSCLTNLRRYGLHPTFIDSIQSIPNLFLNPSCSDSPPVESIAPMSQE